MNSWFPLEWILKSNIFNIKNISMTYHILSRYINARLMRKIQTVNPKGNQSWIFIGRTNAEAETPILCPPDAKNWLIWKDPDAGKDWRQETGTTEDEMVGWHHRCNGHEFEQTSGDSEGQGSLTCCSAWGCKVSDTTEWLNTNNENDGHFFSSILWIYFS